MKQVEHKKRILVAPLNWGLGHATRCIPIIRALQKHNFQPVVASDGIALELLQKEFPDLNTITLPSYNITYSKKAIGFKLKLLKDSPHLLRTIKKEKQCIDTLIENNPIDGIISDNRFGVRHPSIPSVFMTHQLRVLSGNTTWLSTRMHQKIINTFDECWVPDNKEKPNLSGKLGHEHNLKIAVKYIGPLSRFEKQDVEPVYDLMVLLSGPEPQRTILEHKLLDELKSFDGKVLFVKGKVEPKLKREQLSHITVCNYMTSNVLEQALNRSKLILSRSGYTTIMDLAKLEKNAFFVPTPGQFEQEYLAKRLTKEGVIASCKQNNFNLNKLKETKSYSGFKALEYEVNYKKLFSLF